MRELSFSVTGEFVTRIAREWFWLEHKPWDVVEELLLSCMCGTDQSKEELQKLARDVVFGRAKFIGNTADGSYGLTGDDQDLVIRNVESMGRRLKELEKDYSELQRQYLDLAERCDDEGYSWLLEPGSRRKSGRAGMQPILASFLDQQEIEKKFDDNYGWLEPNGTFHPVEWGEHQGWAHNKVLELGWIEEDTETWVDKKGNTRCVWSGEEGDILVDRGWVLLHSPGMGVAKATKSDTKPLTKAQREFLFGYYTDRGLNQMAAEYLEGGG